MVNNYVTADTPLRNGALPHDDLMDGYTERDVNPVNIAEFNDNLINALKNVLHCTEENIMPEVLLLKKRSADLGKELFRMQSSLSACEDIRQKHEIEQMREYLALEVGPELWHIQEIDKAIQSERWRVIDILQRFDWNNPAIIYAQINAGPASE